jgi:acetylornithine aminotransferase
MDTYARYPIGLSQGQGARLFDLDGNQYLDLLAGIAVVNLGHCHPEITEAVAKQAAKLVHVSNLFHQEEQVVLAEALLETWRDGRVFFCNSGAEANEGAIKLARRYMRRVRQEDRYEILTLTNSFHGRTLATLTATGQDKIKDGFDPLPEGFIPVPAWDLEAMDKAMGPHTAAVLLEVIQGEGGVKPFSQDYLKAVQDLCAKAGALFMVDEIQTGLCRTGRFWAHQHFGLTPDVITCAKGLANGLPMGAVLATPEVAKGFVPGSHATTFGGGPLLSVVAAKVIEIMRRDHLDERAARLGAYAMEKFQDLKADFPGKIAEVRGLGLMLGIELAQDGKPVWEKLLSRGFILNLTQGTVLRLLPPLIIAEEDLDRFTLALADVLSED